MGSSPRSRQLFLAGVAVAVLAATHRLTMPVEPVTLDTSVDSQTRSSHTTLHAPTPASPGGSDPRARGVATDNTENRGRSRGPSVARPEGDGHLRISVPAFVRDYLMTPATRALVDKTGRSVEWSFEPHTNAAQALVAGRVDARIHVGRRRRAMPATRSLLLGDFVAAATVHPDNPVREMTKSQLAALLSGFTSDWNRYGGRSRPVEIHGLFAGSDSFGPVIARRLGLAGLTPHVREHPTLEQVARALRGDAGGFAVLPLELARAHGLIALKLDRFEAPRGAAGSLAYPLTIPVVLVTGARSPVDEELASRLAATLSGIAVHERRKPHGEQGTLQVPKPRLLDGPRRGW